MEKHQLYLKHVIRQSISCYGKVCVVLGSMGWKVSELMILGNMRKSKPERCLHINVYRPVFV